MKREAFPQLTDSAYFKIRAAFRQALPVRVTKDWIVANIPGYGTMSAAALLGPIRRLGLIDDQGKPTEIAVNWRLDGEAFEQACSQMMRAAFPNDIIDAVSGSEPSGETIQKLFMARGLGEKTAANVARLFLLLHNRSTSKAGALGASSRSARVARNPPVKASSSRRVARLAEPSNPEAPTRSEPEHTSGLTVLRYFLERGRLAELRIPSDTSRTELRKLFRHLEIDLLEAEGQE